mmetsp:Transcript_32996/g.93441  ORF Transcript_32996/g.93441 Transcript_32996/m.93441 type:complete len:119 (+) Transcript_32996:171-527(+)
MGLATVQRIARAASKPYHLHVELSNRFSYAKVLKNPGGEVLAEASTREAALVQGLDTVSGKEGCAAIGKTVGERLLKSVNEADWSKDIHVVRPRGQRFHGKFAEVVHSFRGTLRSSGA